MKILRAEILGYCMGVRRAAEAVETALQNAAEIPVFTLGPLIHNNSALEDFAQRGVHILEEKNITAVKRKTAIVIRAHGVPPSVREKLTDAGYTTINATCPRVLSSQKIAADYSAKEYAVIIAGDKNHSEVAGIAGCVTGGCLVIENVSDAQKIKKLPEKSILIGQTTITDEEYRAISAVLLKKNPQLKVCSTICPATQERQKALEKLCAQVEGVLVIGGKNSANTARLYKTAVKLCKHAALIENDSEIPPVFFSLKSVGLSAGASTPDAIITKVEDKLKKTTKSEPF